MTPVRSEGDYVCPRCRVGVTHRDAAFHCAGCGTQYPVLCGISDFRLAPDRYLSLADERGKAIRLHDFARTHSFSELVDEYYRITDDVPPEMARRFSDYVLAGEARGRAVLEKLPNSGGEKSAGLLDAGCGAGGLVAAAARAGQSVCGTDIALRWLVIAQKRLAEAGLSAELVCADIAAPPFAGASFGRVAATDLFEHLPDPAAGATSIFRLITPGGRIYTTGANRFTLTTYPPAGLWGVGFLPSALRRRYVVARRGFDTLRYLSMQSPAAQARNLAVAGFVGVRAAPMTIPAERGRSLPALKRGLLGVYRALCNYALSREVLLRIGPIFEISARHPETKPPSLRNVE